MPFLTEELNQKIFVNEGLLIADQWPQPVNVNDGDAVTELRFLIHLITEIRSHSRGDECTIISQTRIGSAGMNELHERSIFNQKAALLRLARLADVNIADGFAKGSARGTVDGLEIGLPLANILDLNAEAERLKKEIALVKAEIEKISKNLITQTLLPKLPKW